MSNIAGGFEVDGSVGNELLAVSGAQLNSSERVHIREGKLVFSSAFPP